VSRLAGLIVAVALLASPRTSAAHGGSPLEKDPCRGEAGGRVIHFSAYQPEVNPTEEYCADVPATGSAILVVDLVDRALRTVPLALRLERADGSVAFESPARPHPDGVMNAKVEFEAPGDYAVVVAFAAGGSVRFPVRVAKGISPLLLGLPLIVLGAPLAYWLSRRRAPVSPGGARLAPVE
jgi:hypothetical protein